MISRVKIARQLREDDIRCLKAIADGQEAQPKTNEIIEQYWLSPWHYTGALAAAIFLWAVVDPESFYYSNGRASYYLSEDTMQSIWGFLLTTALTCYFSWMCLDYNKATGIYDGTDELLKPRTQMFPESWITVVFCSFGSIAFFFSFIGAL